MTMITIERTDEDYSEKEDLIHNALCDLSRAMESLQDVVDCYPGNRELEETIYDLEGIMNVLDETPY